MRRRFDRLSRSFVGFGVCLPVIFVLNSVYLDSWRYDIHKGSRLISFVIDLVNVAALDVRELSMFDYVFEL